MENNRKDEKRQCMDLPDGKTCGDCRYIAHCRVFYGVKDDSRRCDFEPIRFRAAFREENHG